MTRQAAKASVQIENEHVRVTEWRFQPGAATGHHVHAHDYVVVPVTSGDLQLVDEAGTAVSRLETGKAYTRQAGVAHDVINGNPFEFVFIEIELKDTGPKAGHARA